MFKKLLRKHKSKIIRLMSFYPPYLGAGIRVRKCSKDFREIVVEMKLRFWNRNYVGTQFGGSLFSMCDPFYMLMLMENLGPQYLVWDKQSSIRFIRPGRQRVQARFKLESPQIESIALEVEKSGRCYPVFQILVQNLDGKVVAEIEKTISVTKRTRLM